MKILVVAPNPTSDRKRDGFMQRVAAIDSALRKSFDLHYLDSFGYLSRLGALRRDDVVYVHSIYMLQKVLAHLPDIGERVILDLHGVVPEEEALAGNEARSKETQWIEERAFKYVKRFVAVSEAMVDHFKSKYPAAQAASWIVLPIFETDDNETIGLKEDYKVIYAGGAQHWQKIERMIQAIAAAPDCYTFEILTHNPNAFSAALRTGKPVSIRSVPYNEVSAELKFAGMGFLLRDSHVVNRVACPTKLIEYMAAGVVPIVDSPSIGDAERLGYKYLDVRDFEADKVRADWLAEARQINLLVLDRLSTQVREGIAKLKLACEHTAEEGADKPYSSGRALLNAMSQEGVNNAFRLSSWGRRARGFVGRLGSRG